MTQRSKGQRTEPGTRSPAEVREPDLGRPLTARSVIASTLLGMDPPRLPAQLLVRSGELFGIAEGTTRVALSRMVAAGELAATDGSYALAGPLLRRHGRQRASRAAEHRTWSGRWVLAIVHGERRDRATRAALHTAMRELKLATWREGVWIRPDNLDPARAPLASAVVDEQCQVVLGALAPSFAALDEHDSRASVGDETTIAARLWDLHGWADEARALQRSLLAHQPALDAGETTSLAATFVLSAAVLRHLLADPLLPDELLPSDWPGAALRADYDVFDRAFKALWRAWFGRYAHADSPPDGAPTPGR
jgi:phenylacetic acid degradation operon negative regulatory protein